MKTYQSDIHAFVRGVSDAGGRCKCEISHVILVIVCIFYRRDNRPRCPQCAIENCINTSLDKFQVRHPRCVSNESNYNVYVYTHTRSRTYTCPLHPIHPLQMHVYLTDKFSLYNLKFKAETCRCALRIVNSIPPNIQLCLTVYTYSLQFDRS